MTRRMSCARLLEVFVDDFISLAIPKSHEQLDHVANSAMTGMHKVFPPDEDNDNDPISYNKLKKNDGSWMLRKDFWGFHF